MDGMEVIWGTQERRNEGKERATSKEKQVWKRETVAFGKGRCQEVLQQKEKQNPTRQHGCFGLGWVGLGSAQPLPTGLF